MLAPCGAEDIFFVSRVFHKELGSFCKVTKKKLDFITHFNIFIFGF
jgi:hypothetical protein